MSADTLIKKSVTIRPDLDAEVIQRSGPRGYSAYVNQALDAQVARDRLREYLDDAEHRFGSVDPQMLILVQDELTKAEQRRLDLARY